MAKLKVMSVFGTRPEAIKMGPLVKELEKFPDKIDSLVCVTAQHRGMLDQVLAFFGIVPDFDLDIMESKQSLARLTSRGLERLDAVMTKAKPDLVLVHGDTTTTFIASLVAFYHQIPVGHVEAGLRTNNKYSPFPEEINRQLTGILADLHFAPTISAVNNLRAEGKEAGIYLTGNTVIDTFEYTLNTEFTHPVLTTIGNAKYILLTTHRRENHGAPMRQIFNAILGIVAENEDLHVVYPVHPNPVVAELATEMLGKQERIHLIEPVDVVGFHHLMARAHLILTDSGGVQEEAPTLGIPVLVLRDTTERPEGIDAGVSKLVGTDQQKITKTTNELLNDEKAYTKMAQATNPYGDGTASKKIVDAILEYFAR